MNRKHLFTGVVVGLLASGGLAMAVPGPAIATCPPRTIKDTPAGTGPHLPCATTSTSIITTRATRATSTTSTTSTTTPPLGCRPDDDGRYRDENGRFCSVTTTSVVTVDPPRQLPNVPAPVVVVPRFTG